jgi:hypothetical protein
MLVNLKGLFTAQAIAEVLTSLPDMQTTVMDKAFRTRTTHPFPSIGLSDLTAITGTVPVVRRDGQPVSVGGDGMDVMIVAPRPVKPSISVTASELNDLKMLMGNQGAVDAWRNGKIETLRRMVRDTTEAMASIVLNTGSLDWPSRLDTGGVETYTIDYGDILTLTPGLLTTESKVSDAYALLQAMARKVRQAGVGGKVEFFAGADVFGMLMDIVQGWTSTAGGNPVRVDISQQGVIVIGGYSITSMDEQYKHPITGQWVDKLEAKALLAFATDAPSRIWYCAIDSISAQNAAVPFHVVPEALPGDVGYRLIAQSKPLPARNPKTICKAVVVA